MKLYRKELKVEWHEYNDGYSRDRWVNIADWTPEDELDIKIKKWDDGPQESYYYSVEDSEDVRTRVKNAALTEGLWGNPKVETVTLNDDDIAWGSFEVKERFVEVNL